MAGKCLSLRAASSETCALSWATARNQRVTRPEESFAAEKLVVSYFSSAERLNVSWHPLRLEFFFLPATFVIHFSGFCDLFLVIFCCLVFRHSLRLEFAFLPAFLVTMCRVLCDTFLVLFYVFLIFCCLMFPVIRCDLIFLFSGIFCDDNA